MFPTASQLMGLRGRAREDSDDRICSSVTSISPSSMLTILLLLLDLQTKFYFICGFQWTINFTFFCKYRQTTMLLEMGACAHQPTGISHEWDQHTTNYKAIHSFLCYIIYDPTLTSFASDSSEQSQQLGSASWASYHSVTQPTTLQFSSDTSCWHSYRQWRDYDLCRLHWRCLAMSLWVSYCWRRQTSSSPSPRTILAAVNWVKIAKINYYARDHAEYPLSSSYMHSWYCVSTVHGQCNYH